MAGTGWTYNHDTQTLTISRSGLVVSGSVKLDTVDKLSIVLAESAASVTLENLNLKSNAARVIQTQGETNTLVISGENTLSGAEGQYYRIYGNQNLVLRGNGSLDLTGDAFGIHAVSAVTVTGNCTVNIDSGIYVGVTGGTLNVGVENSTTNPTLRIDTGLAFSAGVYTDTVNIYAGELLVNAGGAIGVWAEENVNIYGGILEAEALGVAVSTLNGVYAYYPNGYMKRYATSVAAETDTMTIPYSAYSNGGSDNVLLDQYNAEMAPTYIRLSPLSSEELRAITLSVTYNGKEYSAPIVGSQYKYYYIDLDNLNDTYLKSFIHEGMGRNYTSDTGDHKWLVVARNEMSPNLTLLEPMRVEWEIQGDSYVPYVVSINESYEYRLSGGSNESFGNAIEVYDGVSRLTLDNLTGSMLNVHSTPVYLKGENYVIDLVNVPLNTDGTLNLYSDGTGTLTINARTISDSYGLQPQSAVAADKINLYDVKSLTLISGTKAITSGSGADINFFDGDSELTYGQGWGIDEGTNGATASTLSSATVSGGEYLKIYADTTDGIVTPNYLSVDKASSDLVKTFNLKYCAVNGKLGMLKTGTSGDQTYASVLLIDSDGKETQLKLAKGSSAPSGYHGYYTDNGTGATLTLDLGTIDLEGMALGAYTLRFQQQDAQDNVYNTDAILNVTNSAASYGDLTIEPGNVTLSPGQSITFSTSYEGTTPNSYVWAHGLMSDVLQQGVSSKFTYTVPEDAKAGDIIYMLVVSFSGDTVLGVAQSTITVCDAAKDIQITTADLEPADDGSYTIHSVTPTGEPGQYDFDAAVTMLSGADANADNVSFRLWGNNLRATTLDANTGVLTVARKETGTNGIMKVIATYTNDDGTTYSEEILLNISTDAYVGLNVVGTINGEAVADIHGSLSSNLDEEGYIAGGTAAVIVAQPEENHQVANWTVSGNEVSGKTPSYTVDEETDTLTLDANEFGVYTVSVEFTHYHDQLKHDETNHWYECACGDMNEITAHYDDDKDHNCDKCDFVMTVCDDENKDHFCDWCGEKMTECADDSLDHFCDWCGAQLSEHADETEDHICEYCNEKISECADDNYNHFCDFCKEKMTECEDVVPTDEAGHTDHICDICDRTLTECADAKDDADHNCDICGVPMATCADKDNDHLCDTCEEKLTECADDDNDHLCDLCTEKISDCADHDNNHNCDVCGEVLSECVNEDKDHNCDICGKTLSECVDADPEDHNCDVCGEPISACADEDKNHLCDLCNAAISTCEDEDEDHLCDTCGKTVSECADEEITDEAGHTDHYCDLCGKHLTPCEDADEDQICDICGAEMATHECADETQDHLCDTCGATASECTDSEEDQDHNCDICGAVIGECADSEEPKDHNCDVCGEKLSECADGNNDHKCDICGATLSECADNSLDHKCDICGDTLSQCEDKDPADHICDICSAELGQCEDKEPEDHNCDVCGQVMTSCVDENKDHDCDICGKEDITACGDTDNDHYCDLCTEKISECADSNNDHDCDICGKEDITECADGNNDHNCDICGETLSECADNDDDHVCDICSATLSTCGDTDNDHNCDTCGKENITACGDADNDHNCDICGACLSDCADSDNDHNCDTCGGSLSECADSDEDSDHDCDLCGKTMNDCLDEDSDHLCDVCGETLTECVDEDNDHLCDICGKRMSQCKDEDEDGSCDDCEEDMHTCVDEDLDHNCDICDFTLSECCDEQINEPEEGEEESTFTDHICDYCGQICSQCVDGNNDHVCDICGEQLTDCLDEDDNHACDICGAALSSCQDEDRNHLCDVCGEPSSECADNDNDHLCDVCGIVKSECIDEVKDHKCDICGKTLSECADTDNDHLCDHCGATLSQCVDADHNDECDICGEKTFIHPDENRDHRCDGCALPLSECDDSDNDHLCDYCGVVWSVCVDENTDHSCDICGGNVGTHVPAEDSHICDYCGQVASECADNDNDHLCDVCDEELSVCGDSDNDHMCDICGAELSECADIEPADHNCDICGETLSECADADEDGYCDHCGAAMIYTITVMQTTGGKVTADKENAVMGETVTVTVASKFSTELDTMSVVDEDGNAVAFTDNGDGTYTFIQPADHVRIEVLFRDVTFSISLASMTMANSLDMNFAFKQAYREDWTGYYAKIEKEYENADSAVQYIFFEDWKTTTIGGEAYYYVTFTGIAAKEMTDTLYVTIYDAKGNQVSTVWEDSVQAQAMRNLAKANVTKEARTMVVDMLNYGAAAQTRFEYNTDNLANSLLSEEQRSFATATVSYVDTSVHGDNYRANVYLVSNIQFMMAFTGIDQSMNAVVTFKDHYGKSHEITIHGSEFTKNGGYHVLTIEETVIADAFQNINCKIYDANGTLVTEVTDSMASYAARAKQNTGNDLYEMIMKFATSAHAYLHKK